MVLSWLKRRRRARLASKPFPESWQEILQRNVFLYNRRSERQQERIRRYVQIFVAEKNWEGCGGLQMTDEVRVTIAGQVAVLVLGMDEEFFDRVLSVLVYPNAYVAPDTSITRAGVVIEGGSAREGEAWYGGPVILSWADAVVGGQSENDGVNLVFHEFAHQLDMLNGQVADGVPVMKSAAQADRWLDVVPRHYRRLIHDCEHRHHSLFDCYGATSMSEFFAVVTEVFFQRPDAMKAEYPELFEVFSNYFLSDVDERSSDSR